MTGPIPYDEMRRILGLPARRNRIRAPWAVRKVREGVSAGRWGVWRLSGGTHELVEAHRVWSDAISDACTRSDGR
ncbi:hypothetical protein LCL87_21500 [Rhodococcus hoagii]|nr:hypothetical protein [Prescottella equi]